MSLINTSSILDGPLSFIVGSILLLVSGIFVSNFIGNEIIISGLRGEKKLVDKAEEEVKTQADILEEINGEIKKIYARLDDLEKRIK